MNIAKIATTLKSAFGFVASLVTSNGVSISAGPTNLTAALGLASKINVALAGDSLTAQNYRVLSTGLSVTVSGGVGTMTLTAHGMPVGTSFRICKTTNTSLNSLNNGWYTVASYIDANNVTFSCVGVPDTVSAATGGSVNCSNIKPNNGYFNVLQSYIGQKFNEVYNGGISGDRSDQLLARVSEFTSLNVEKIFLLIGTNDALNNIDYATCTTNIRAILDAFLRAGKNVELLTIPPITTPASPVGRTLAQVAQFIIQVNKWIVLQGQNDPRIKVRDLYAAIVDPTVSTGAARSGYTRPDDGIHLTARGSQAFALSVASAYSDIPTLPRVQSATESYSIDNTSKQILANPNFTGSGGSAGTGITGTTVASNWSLSRTGTATATATTSARADGFGNDQVLTMITSAAGERVIADSEALISRVSIGDTVYFQFDINVNDVTGIQSFQPCFNATIGGVSFLWRGDLDAIGITNNPQYTSGSLTKTIRCRPFTIPTGTTALSLRIDTVLSGTVQPVIKIGRAEVRKL